MVGERRQRDIVAGNDAHLVAVSGRGIGLAVHLERFRGLAQEGVDRRIETLLPIRGKHLVGVLHHGVDIGARRSVQLAVHGQFLQAGHRLLRHQAVVLGDMEHVTELGTGAEADVAVGPDELVRTVLVGVAHDEHLGEVRIRGRVLDVLDADDFRLEETQPREAPAGAGAVLVLDGGDRVLRHHGELVLGGLGGQGVCTGEKRRDTGGENHLSHIGSVNNSSPSA